MRLLEQVVAELRRVCGASRAEALYAQHLLQSLEYIRDCVPTRR
jgi:hypothetical protein